MDTTIQKVMLPGQTPSGEPIISVLVKRSYDIVSGKKCTRAERDNKLLAADVFYADPANSSVRFESDFVPFKLATDVVFNGVAYSPDGRPTDRLVAELQVHKTRKRIQVLGDRICEYRAGQTPAFTDPKPFTTMELKYERAYGGVDIFSNPQVPFPYMRNPLGRGFAVANVAAAISGLALPNIEDENDSITPDRLCCKEFTTWQNQPVPAGIGWLPKGWLPRSALAGILPADRALEQELRKAYTALVPVAERAGYAKTSLPTMDFKFFNGASSGLTLPFLKGDEGIKATNLSPDKECVFRLPGDTVKIGIDIGKGSVEPNVFIQTVMIRMEDRQLDIVWRGAIPFEGPDWFPKMTKMEISVL